jgi:hypothetical protein
MDPQLERLLNDSLFRYSDSLTIGYLIALRGYANPVNMEGINGREYAKGFDIGLKDRETLEKEGRRLPVFFGYVPDGALPLKVGQEVTIPKGTLIWYRGTSERSKRARKIKIHHFISGSNFHVAHHGELVRATSPKVVWPGGGGYWSEVDINDIPEALEAVRKKEADERHNTQLVRIQAMESVLNKVVEDLQTTPVPEKAHFTCHTSRSNEYVQYDAIVDDTKVANISIDTYYVDGKLTLRINVTSSVCHDMARARVVFAALSWVMAQAERIDATYLQPWNAQ